MTAPRIALAFVVVLGLAVAVVRPLAAGVLLAAGILTAPVLGAAVLLCIGDLTGGRWREANAPVFLALARLWPALIVAGALVAVGAAGVFPPLAAPPDKVPAIYFASPFFALRAVLILLAWMALCLIATGAVRSPGRAAGALLAFVAATSFASYDWILSLDAPCSSTVFPALWIVAQIAAALALAAVLAANAGSASDCDDLAQLTAAAVLGTLYLAFMQYLVIWGGDLPDRAGYFTRRMSPMWDAWLVAALVCGGLVPLALLSVRRARRHPITLRVAGAFVLTGFVSFQVWQIAPGLDLSLAPALLAAVLVIAGAATLSRLTSRAVRHV